MFRGSVSLLFLACLIGTGAHADPKYALTLYGNPPFYGPDFTHFNYVNPNAPKGGKLRLSGIGTFDSLNPFVIKGTPAAGLTLIYPSLLYVTLTQHSYDEPSAEYGYAAETIDLAEDRLSVTFKLRPGITFHDGSAITADDVIYSFEMLTTKGNPLFRNYYGDVKKVSKVDDRTIRFDFKDNKNRELPLILGQFPIVSKAFYKKHGFEKADLTIPLGNGPYKISKVDAGRSITYERVKDWWGDKLPICVGRYNFNEVQYIYFRDADISFEAFKSGEYSLRTEHKISNWVLRYNFPAVKEGKVIKLEVPERQVGIMQASVMNTRRDLFKDPRVREALNYAFDFEWINKNFFYGKYTRCNSYYSGTELAAQSKISPAEEKILAPFKDKLPPELFSKPFQVSQTNGSGNDRNNLRKARELLAQAGWVIKDGVLINAKTKAPFEFEILLNQPDLVKIYQNFIKNLELLGITAKIRLVDTSQYVIRVNNFDFDMTSVVLGQSLSPGNEQREFWSSHVADLKGSRNYAGIKDPVVNQLVELVIDAPDRQTLLDRTHALDRVLLWGYYVIPMYYSSVTRIAYWDYLEHPAKFPKYNLDLDAFWTKPEKK